MMNVWLLAALCILGSAAVTALLLPSTMLLAPHIGAVDIPRDNRRMHTRPIPRCGGVALFTAFWAILLATGIAERSVLRLLFATALLTLMGLLDDVFGISAPWKLMIQLCASYIVVQGTWEPPMVLLVMVWLCLLTNAHNMIDGVDGLAGGVVAVESGIIALLLFFHGDGLGAAIALAVLGICAGYLPYNTHPAKVFMGDEGALFLGFMIGWLTLRVSRYVHAPFLVALLICAVPVSDLLFVVIRRLLRGQNPLRADRGHLHHLLADHHLGQRQICLCLIVPSAVLGLIALLVA